MRNRIQHAAALVTILLLAQTVNAQTHDIPEHGLRVDLPRGWERMESLSGNTILKIARADSLGKQARIVIVTFLIEEPVDLSTISRDDHIRALEGGSIFGEQVSVLDVGRTTVGGIDALWGKTHRNLPSRGSTYEYTYEFFREYKGIPKGFTIRLTSYGDQSWFQSNSVTFDRFIRSIAFNQRSGVATPIPPQLQPRTNSVPPITPPTQPLHDSPPIKITEGDPIWLALLKAYGETFLLILLATVVLGIGKWIYSRYVASKDTNAG